VFITDTVQEAINNGGTKIDLNLVPVQQTEVPVAPQTNQPSLPTPPTQM
jgi:putative lipoprotein